jgi:hypothetical protein
MQASLPSPEVHNVLSNWIRSFDRRAASHRARPRPKELEPSASPTKIGGSPNGAADRER